MAISKNKIHPLPRRFTIPIKRCLVGRLKISRFSVSLTAIFTGMLSRNRGNPVFGFISHCSDSLQRTFQKFRSRRIFHLRETLEKELITITIHSPFSLLSRIYKLIGRAGHRNLQFETFEGKQFRRRGRNETFCLVLWQVRSFPTCRQYVTIFPPISFTSLPNFRTPIYFRSYVPPSPPIF